MVKQIDPECPLLSSTHTITDRRRVKGECGLYSLCLLWHIKATTFDIHLQDMQMFINVLFIQNSILGAHVQFKHLKENQKGGCKLCNNIIRSY